MKKCAIMQPTFLPWLGYFDLMDQVDFFVILDSVQFSKQSWQQRNRIKGKDSLEMVTIPVLTANIVDKKISAIKLADNKKLINVLLRIQNNYRKSKYYKEYWDGFSAVYLSGVNSGSLAVLNYEMIQWVKKVLNIKTKLLKSSELNLDPGLRRSQILIEILKKLNSNFYISTPGAMDYLVGDFALFEEENIEIYIHSYDHPIYNQINPPFIAYSSIIDLIFCEGHNSLDVLRSGRGNPPLLQGSEK